MFENLKDMMGDAYKEDMTAEDVNNFFAGKKFTDLSTGLYVDKNKYERDVQSLQATIAEKQNALNAKLTDDEKAQQEKLNKDKEIQRLTELLKTNTLNSNKSMAIGNTADVKSILKSNVYPAVDVLIDSMNADQKGAAMSFMVALCALDETISPEENAFLRKLLD